MSRKTAPRKDWFRPAGSEVEKPMAFAAALTLLRDLGYEGAELPRLEIRERERVLPSSYRVDELAAATIAATHAAAALASRDDRVSVDSRQAALYFRSERYLRVD